MVMHCPLCQKNTIGKVGTERYFCWECGIEFVVDADQSVRIFSLEEDGTLSVVQQATV